MCSSVVLDAMRANANAITVSLTDPTNRLTPVQSAKQALDSRGIPEGGADTVALV